MFGDEKFPPPYVPEDTFTRPAGAAVDVDGKVACVTCAVRLPLAQADVVGEGYRCVACSGQAHVAALEGRPGGGAAHFSEKERSTIRASGQRMARNGVLVCLAGLLLFVILPGRAGAKAGFVVGGCGILMVVAGFTRRGAAD